MKLKSLILGSIAAAGLSTAGYAADLGVLTSLDVCDSLGISGLTISSDTNCLQISGGVKYEFYWGDYKDEPIIGRVGLTDSILGGGATSGNINIIGAGTGAGPTPDNLYMGFGDLDWRSKTQAWLKFVGSADSDFGTAKAVLTLEYNDRYDVRNEGLIEPHGDNPDRNASKMIKEAYVSVGDSTVLMAGKKSTIGNFGDSQPFNFLRTFGYNEVDNGILLEGDEDGFGGHVIQIVSDLGNGVSVGAALENLEGTSSGGGLTGTQSAGTLVGVVSYAGESITAHLTGFAGGILDGTTDFYGLHAGATGTFEQFKVRAALGYLQNEVIDDSKLHALISAEAGFDMFTVALSAEYTDAYGKEGYGLGGSVGFAVTDGIKINLGSRWFHADAFGLAAETDTIQVAAQLVAAVTETIEVTGEIGGYFGDGVETSSLNVDSVGYGALGLKWAPGGGFTSSLKGEATTESAYKVSFTAEKTFD